MGYTGVKITIIGVSLPPLMVAVGSSYSIHILNQYYIDFNEITFISPFIRKSIINARSIITITNSMGFLGKDFKFLMRSFIIVYLN